MIWNSQKHGTTPTRLHTSEATAMPELSCLTGIGRSPDRSRSSVAAEAAGSCRATVPQVAAANP